MSGAIYLKKLSWILLIVSLVSCSGVRQQLRTEEAGTVDPGTYTLILFGARYGGDIETVAFLDKEGDGYTFEVYAPDFDYRVMKGIPADQARAKAESFVSHHYAFDRSVLSRIFDLSGNPIGYEVRPLYRPLEFGYTDVLDIGYTIAGGKVIIRIWLKPELKWQIGGEGRGASVFGGGQ